MKIQDQNGQDITADFAPDATSTPSPAMTNAGAAASHSQQNLRHSFPYLAQSQDKASTIAAAQISQYPDDTSVRSDDALKNAQRPDTSQTASVDPTHAALMAYHAAQHAATVTDAPDDTNADIRSDYVPTPGEQALHAATSMIAQHVEALYRLCGTLEQRIADLEGSDDDG